MTMIAPGSKSLADVAREYRVSLYVLVRCRSLGLLGIDRSGGDLTMPPQEEARLLTILKGLSLGFSLDEMKMLFDTLPSGPARSIDPAP